jgi:GDP-L-fucose synthase
MALDLRTSRIVVTGGAGFLGSYVVDALKTRGAKEVIVPRSREYDLVDRDAVRRLYRDAQPDLLIHLAAVVGGIGANRENPGRFYFENLMMGALLFEEGRLAKLSKLVAIGTICAYPKFAPIPFHEDAIWDGFPEETNAPYGVAKKVMAVQSEAYRAQYGFNSIFLLPVNLYGPRDNFDPASSHVIPALIKKCADAIERKDPEIVCWGDGTPTREFIHARDAAEGIVRATEGYDSSDPVNIGAGFEISIRALTELIAKLTGFTGTITWDASKPNGQPRRKLDTARAKERFGFEAKIGFEEGLRETIDWYRAQKR